MGNKFKVGDKVRILDGSGISDYYGCFVASAMGKHIGTIATIRTVGNSGDRVWYRMDEISCVWDERGLEVIDTAPSITITQKGNKTIAVQKMGDRFVKSAKAICRSDETYDFEVGAKLAVERLLGVEKVEVAEYREVKRQAKVGEWVKVVNAYATESRYDNGDILLTIESNPKKTGQVPHIKADINGYAMTINTMEYVVLENYKSEPKFDLSTISPQDFWDELQRRLKANELKH